MKIVFFHTDDPVYTRYADLLEASLKKCKFDYYRESIPCSAWHSAINNKAAFLLRCREKFKGNLVYCDADAFVHRNFSEDFKERDFDIAYCRYRDYITGREENLAGTIFISDNDIVRVFLKKWKDKCDLDNNRWDQATLSECIEELPQLNILNLDYVYTYIFDNPNFLKLSCDPVIEHLQASRISQHNKNWFHRLIKRPNKKTRRTYKRTRDLEVLLGMK